MMIKSLLLEEKGGDVEAFKFTAALCIIRGKMMMMMMVLTKWMLYDNQIKSLLIIILCTCFGLLEKQMSKISVSKIPTKDSIL